MILYPWLQKFQRPLWRFHGIWCKENHLRRSSRWIWWILPLLLLSALTLVRMSWGSSGRALCIFLAASALWIHSCCEGSFRMHRFRRRLECREQSADLTRVSHQECLPPNVIPVSADAKTGSFWTIKNTCESVTPSIIKEILNKTHIASNNLQSEIFSH